MIQNFPIVNLSIQDNTKLLQQLESGFKRTINWNKYQSKVTIERQNKYLYCLIDSIFQGVKRHFVYIIRRECGLDRINKVFSSNYRNKRLQCYDRWTKKSVRLSSKN